MLKPSEVTVEKPSGGGAGSPEHTFVAYGDRDDHLRLAVLIAAVFSKAARGEERSLADLCLRRETSWRERLDAVTELLDRLPRRPSAPAHVFVDVDALYTGRLEIPARWDDGDFAVARAEFLATIIAAVARGGWVLARSAPTQNVSDALEAAGLAVPRESGGDAKSDPIVLRAQPEARPVLGWLLDRGILTPSTALEAAEGAGGDPLTEYLVFLAYDSLPPSARRLAARLAVLRPPQHLNSEAYGPYTLGAETGQEETGNISQRSLARLIECGFVQSFRGDPHLARMPRGVRRSLLAYTARLNREELLAQHEALAAPDLGHERVEGRIETHHHAVLAGNVERAVATTLYYVNDLREVAYRLSHEQQFDAAAKLYDVIVHADPGDAYAWEYLGYNLARANQPRSPELASRIVAAYENASHLEEHNPLFRGRLLGFRGEIGEDIVPELAQWFVRYEQLWGAAGLSYFGEGVLEGLRRGGRDAMLEAVKARWRRPLLRAPRLERFFQG